jgi:putative phage-type endonuclease
VTITKEQLIERRSGIGGSDAAIILGIHPFRDVLWLYHEKRGTLPIDDSTDENTSLKWGSYLEDPICEAYADQTGFKVIRQLQTLRSEQHPFMIANVDRRVVGLGGRRLGFEAKSDAFGFGWGPSGSDEIPPYIMCQIQHYLYVTGWDEWDLGCLIGNRDFRVYKIARIQSIIDKLIEAEQDFWDHVQHGVQPEPNYEHRATRELIQRLYPGTNGKVIRLPEVAQSYTDVMNDAKEQVSLYESVVTGCKNRIAMLMGEASAGLLPDGTCFTRKEIQRSEYTVAASSYMDMRHVTKLPKLVTDAIEKNLIIEHSASIKALTQESTDAKAEASGG